MSTTRKRNPEATRKAILEAAEEVFLAKGFGNSTLSEIAGRAGVTKSLIHHHFGSKEGLWREVKLRRFRQYAEGQMAMLHEREPALDLLVESLRGYFRFLQQNPEVVRILAWLFLEQDTKCTECLVLDRELTILGIKRLREAQEAGELRADLNPAFILFTFIGIAQHWFQDKGHLCEILDLSPDSRALDKAYLDDFLKIFLEGVLPR